MKNISILLSIITFSFSIAQQAPEIEWSNNYGGSDVDRVYSSIKDFREGYIIVGETKSNDGDTDGLLIKINEGGDIVWQKTFGSKNDEYIADVSLTVDGGYVLGANSHSLENDFDYWIIKLDGAGETTWERKFGGSNFDGIESIIQTTDRGFLISGVTFSNDGDITQNKGYGDFWILKLSEDGELEWQKTLGGSESEWARSAQQTSDGGYIIAGNSNSVDGDVSSNIFPENAWVVKLNQFGEMVWEKSFGELFGDTAYKIKELSNGDFVFVGYKGDNFATMVYSDAWVVKIDQEGNTIWNKTFGGSFSEIFYDFFENSNGDLFVSGITYSQNGDVHTYHKGAESWVIKLNSSGEFIWSKAYGGNNFDSLRVILQTGDSKILLVGTSSSQDGDLPGNFGMEDFWAFKINPDQMSTSEINSNQISIYPNPVKDILNFSEELKNIEIHSLAGQKVAQEKSGSSIQVNQLSSGTYVLTAETKNGQNVNLKFIKN